MINNTDSPKNGRDFAILSLIISLVAVVIAGIAFNIPFSEVSRDVAYNKAITLAGLIIGVLGVGATVYFVIMGIDIYRYKSELENIIKRIDTINARVDDNKRGVDFELLDVMSMLENISDDMQKKSNVRLAMGRIICKSKIHTEKYPLEKGIMYLGQYSRSQEDIDTLQKLANNTDSKTIKDQVEGAIKQIEKKRNKAQTEA